jgi:hypothetical protein
MPAAQRTVAIDRSPHRRSSPSSLTRETTRNGARMSRRSPQRVRPVSGQGSTKWSRDRQAEASLLTLR